MGEPVRIPRGGALTQPDKPVIVFPTARDPEVTWKTYDHIAPGTYPAYSRSARIVRDSHYKRWLCLVQFDILDDALVDSIAQLAWFLNLGHGEKPHAGRRSKYWSAWCLANGGHPLRNARLSPSVFLRRQATVVVEDVWRDHQGTVSTEAAYSKIELVLSWNTGGGK